MNENINMDCTKVGSTKFHRGFRFFGVSVREIPHYLRINSWKPYYTVLWVLTLGGRILGLYPERILVNSQHSMDSMNYFDSDMSNSTNTVVHFDEKSGNLCPRLRLRQGRTQFMWSRFAVLSFIPLNSSMR
jgi:hypothetical protein